MRINSILNQAEESENVTQVIRNYPIRRAKIKVEWKGVKTD